MSERNDGRAPSGSGDRYALEVLRVQKTGTLTLQMLSKHLRGVLVHHVKETSIYCRGKKDCRADWHKEPPVWKGYVCAAMWNDLTACWYPCVFEVTEAAELQMRGIYKRGQVWEFWKECRGKSKRGAVRAVLRRELPAAEVLPDFDMLPVVRYLYHDLDVVVDLDNPMPSRPMAAPVQGLPARCADAPPSAEPLHAGATFRKILAERQNGNSKGGSQ